MPRGMEVQVLFAATKSAGLWPAFLFLGEEDLNAKARRSARRDSDDVNNFLAGAERGAFGAIARKSAHGSSDPLRTTERKATGAVHIARSFERDARGTKPRVVGQVLFAAP